MKAWSELLRYRRLELARAVADQDLDLAVSDHEDIRNPIRRELADGKGVNGVAVENGLRRTGGGELAIGVSQ